MGIQSWHTIQLLATLLATCHLQSLHWLFMLCVITVNCEQDASHTETVHERHLTTSFTKSVLAQAPSTPDIWKPDHSSGIPPHNRFPVSYSHQTVCWNSWCWMKSQRHGMQDRRAFLLESRPSALRNEQPRIHGCLHEQGPRHGKFTHINYHQLPTPKKYSINYHGTIKFSTTISITTPFDGSKQM